MIDFAIRLTIVLALVAICDVLILRAHTSAAFRHMVWAGAIIAVMLLPVFNLTLPELRVPVYAGAARITVPDAQPAAAAAPAIMHERSYEPREAVPVSAERNIAWPVVLGVLYAIVAAALMMKIVVEMLMVRSLSRGAKALEDTAWNETLTGAVATLGVRRNVRLLVSDRNVMPMTFGIVRPIVLLPSTALTWGEQRRRSVLLHEISHVARHDCGTQLIAAAACAIYWIHPMIWYAAHRMRVEREFACDDSTLMGGVAPRSYAQDLLEIAHAHLAPVHLRTAAVSMATSLVESRLLAVIDARRPRVAPRRGVKALLALVALGALIPLSTLRAVERTESGSAFRSLAASSTDLVPPQRRAEDEGSSSQSVVQASESMTFDATDEPAAPAPAVSSQSVQRGEWALRLAEPGEGGIHQAAAHMMLHAPGLNTFYVPIALLRGLDAQIAERGGEASFTLEREAGTLRFTGTFTNGRGKGTFEFTQSRDFNAQLVRRGMREATGQELFTLARHGLGSDLLDALAAAGYATPSTEEYVRASLTGVDAVYVRERAARGVTLGTLRELISYYNNSDDADEAAPLPAVRPAAKSTTPLSGTWTLAKFRGGVTQLELFWTDKTNWRRDIDIEQLQGSLTSGSFRMVQEAGTFEFSGTVSGQKSAGSFVFSPNRDFVNTLRSLGVVMNENVSDHSLKNLAWGGTTTKDVREFRALGFPQLTIRELIDLAIFQVPSDFLRSERARGVTFATVADLIDAWRERK